MKRLTILSVFVVVFALVLTSCDDEGDMMNISGPSVDAQSSDASLMKVGRVQIWADGILFNSIATPATFKPESDPFDILFVGADFKDDAGHISESKPGDKDYNGGRWEVWSLRDGVDGSKYDNATSDDDLNLNDFEPAGVYFECPLLPRK